MANLATQNEWQSKDGLSAFTVFGREMFDQSLTWKDVQWLAG